MADILPFPEWRPDLTPYQGEGSTTIKNVVPRGDGYGPFSAFNALTSALAATCRGYFHARNTDGSITVFAGTANRLFQLNNTDSTWTPVSKVTALTSISNASPAVFTLASHGLAAGDALVLSTSGSLPTGLTVGTVYYVISSGLTANAFQVSTGPGGSAVNTSSAGSGTHSMTWFYSDLPASYHWQFAQFGSLVIAVKPSTAPQVFTLGSSTAFGDLSGSPPQAAYIAVVGRFVVLSGLTSNPFRIQWSALGDATAWTTGTNSSDSQDLPDGGIVRGVAGGEYGVIFQETSMRRMIYAPGSSVVFVIERIAQDKGLLAPYSLIRAGERIFFLSATGFHALSPTGYPEPIGKERFDRTFFESYDSANLQLIIGAPDPTQTRVYWAFKTASSSGSLFDRLFVLRLRPQPRHADRGERRISRLAGGARHHLGKPRQHQLVDRCAGGLARRHIHQRARQAVGGQLRSQGWLLLRVRLGGDARHLRAIGRRTPRAGEGSAARDRRRDLLRRGRLPREPAIRRRLFDRAGGERQGPVPGQHLARLARGRLRIPAATAWTFASGFEPEFAPEGKR